MSDDSVNMSKKDQRVVSEFVGQELLYDYVTLNLDPERTQAIDKLVKESRDLQEDIQKINDGLSYCEHLSETVVADFLVDRVKTPSTYFQVILQKLKVDRWPSSLRLGVEAMIIAAVAVTAAMLIPWQRLTSVPITDVREVVIVEAAHESPAGFGEEAEVSNKLENEKPLYNDEGATLTTTTSTVVTTTTLAKPLSKAEAKALAAKLAAEKKAQVLAEKKAHETTTSIMPVTASAAMNAAEAPSTTLVPRAEADPVSESDKSGQGWLYRGSIGVSNLSATSNKFIEKITEIGGRKAGEVPLGWKKGGGTYFHFTMPEKQYEAFVQFMNEYGKLKIQKEKHPRVMPEGIIRVIITVDEAGGKKR